MAYDSAVASFTTKTDKVDLVQAAHMNSVQSELVTIETILGTNVKGNRTDLKTRLNNALDADGSILSGTAYPSPALASQPFYRTDLDTFYIRDTANNTWLAQGGNLSNVIFSFCGNSTTFWTGTSTSYVTVIATKWKKISGVATVTIYATANALPAGQPDGYVNVDIGGQAGEMGTFPAAAGTWLSVTINVSTLTNGTVYDVVIQVKSATSLVNLQSIIAFGS